jgi:hypothetical protein
MRTHAPRPSVSSDVRTVQGAGSVRLKELTPTCYLGGVCRCGECGWDIVRFPKVYRPRPGRLEALDLKICEPV